MCAESTQYAKLFPHLLHLTLPTFRAKILSQNCSDGEEPTQELSQVDQNPNYTLSTQLACSALRIAPHSTKDVSCSLYTVVALIKPDREAEMRHHGWCASLFLFFLFFFILTEIMEEERSGFKEFELQHRTSIPRV
jgi:hypothetical protein